MHPILSQSKPQFESALDYLHKEFAKLRTGRATPALVEDIQVNAYDSMMELRGVASISVPDAKSLLIDPWDKSLVKNIEKGIRDAGIGLAPVVDGNVLRITLAPMTEENRKNMVRLMKEYVEESKVKVRHVREHFREQIIKQEKDKQLSEDEKFKLLDELDKMTKEFTERVCEIGVGKEQEIMTV